MVDKLISPVHAQAATLCELDDMIIGLFEKIWPFVGIALLGMIIYGGAMWMMSQGDPQLVAKSTKTLLWAVIGTFILALVMVILGIFESILGLPAGTFPKFQIC